MRRIVGYGLLVAGLVALAGCGGPLTYNIQSSRLAPGGDAEIVADVKEELNQTSLTVHVKNLPPPARVNPNATAYVGWIRKGSSAPWSRVGTVLFDTEGRTGELTGTVPEQSFDFEISAEPNEGAQSPSSDVVFSQRIAK